MKRTYKIFVTLIFSFVLLLAAGMCVYASGDVAGIVDVELAAAESENEEDTSAEQEDGEAGESGTNEGEENGDTEKPQTPATLEVTPVVSGHNVTLSWNAVDGASKYYVYSNGTLIKTVTETTCTLVDQKCSSTAYTYKVEAVEAETEDVLTEGTVTANVNVTFAAPTLKSAAFTTATSAKVQWNSVAGADSYIVYRKIGSGSWEKLTSTPVTGTSYVDKTVKLGNTYTYSVGVYDSVCGKDPVSYNTTGVKASYLSAAKVNSAAATSKSSVTVKWNQVSGATGYYVYAKIENGSWKEIKKITSASTTSYKYELSSKYWGKKVTFKVRPYNSSYKALDSNTKSVTFKPAKVTLKSATQKSYKSNTVKWNKVSGATGYKIYRKTKTGSYKLIGTVKGSSTVSYVDDTAKIGTTYYYTVRAYWKTEDVVQNGSYDSDGVKVKTSISKPKMVSAKCVGTKIEVTWKKVSGATGYRVYRKTGNGDWEKVKTIKSGSTLSYTDKNVSWNKTYTYTVKAYRKVNGTTYWSKRDENGLSAKLYYKAKTKKVTDKNSVMYGKTLKLYYDSEGNQIQNVEDIVGKQSTYYLYVNKTKQYVTAYYKDGKYYVPVRAMICSSGASDSYTPNGTFKTSDKYRWHELMGPCWGQWCTRITGGVLFHSVFYNSYNNNKTLAVSSYNRLGTKASHGCVRLTAADAKWIYDNCKTKTTVKIYQKSGYEPLEKPTAYKLSSSHSWDPTDPNMKYLCEKYGCH